MRASHLSSSTTMGSVRPSRLAVATSPQVIWKQPSPIRQTAGRSGRASLAAIAAGRPKPIDDQPLVMRKLFGACAVHWPAIWWVCAPTSKASSPSRGSARRTASIAACAAKVGERLRAPGIGGGGERGQPRQRGVEIAGRLMDEIDRGRDIDRLDVDLQERNVADPGLEFHLDGVVAEADDQVGRPQQ